MEKFPDFRVRFIYRKGDPRYWKWTPLAVTPEVYRELAKLTDVYWSIARFTEDALHASEEELRELEYVLPLFFDVDCHDAAITLHRASQKTWELFNWIKRLLHLKEDQIVAWMSGRGFHLGVSAEIVLDHPVTSSDYRERDFRKLAALAIREVPMELPVRSWSENGSHILNRPILDLSIYGFKKLIRVPGSRHSHPRIKAANRKIRLSSQHLKVLASKSSTHEFNKSLALLSAQPFLQPGENL